MARSPLAGYSDVRVLGLEQAKKNLLTLSDKLQKQIIRQSARIAVNIVAKKVKATTYGGKRTRRSGLLELSQAITSSVKKDEVIGRIKMREIQRSAGSKGSRWLGPVNPNAKVTKAKGKRAAFYWWFLEHGTAKRTTERTKANRGSVGASPWVVPAFDATVSEALDAFEKNLAARLEDECQRLPKTPTGV